MSGPTSEDSPSAGPVTAVRATSDAASIDEARAEGSAADESFAADVDSGHDLVRERMVALRRRPDPVVRDLILGRIFGEEHRSATIGRFTIVGKIGAGAMGVVYEAIDPQLGRHVALKVLQADDTDPTAQARLLREARAIAMVSHPNVITVYEAGDVGGQVYLAMERVHGAALDAWLAPADGRRRSTREILEVFIAAGRGLAAAHAAGIIHRDFKPSNVMVGDDGRVRVLDFGLARDDASTATDELVTTGRDQGRDRWPPALALTRTGALLGTPAYMAPEQHRGEPATEQSDLFSFCVALYEAIYGQHPFPCHSYAALREAVLTGRVREAPRIRGVPAWLRRALSRGLALDPGARPPSMIDLLRHLDRRRSSAVVRAAIGAGVMTTLIGIGLAAHTLMRPASLTIDVRGRGRPIAGATVLLDGVALSTAEEGARAEVAAGVHGVEIAAEGYRRASRAIELERGDNRHLEVALEREQGRFTLDVEPAGSLVTIDGVDHGSRLRAVAVDTGAHALLIRRDGYHDHRLQWEARTDELREGYVSLAPALPWSRRVDDHNERLEVLGDVDGDGLDDVLVERTKELVAVDPRRDRDLWRLTPVDHYDGGAWLQDLDRDGVKDVIIVDHGGGAAALEAWSSAARGPSAAPRRLWRVSGAGRASEANKPTTIHVDIDGDGDVDVVTAWLDDRRLEAFEAHTGRRLWRAAAAEASIDDLKLARDREGRPVILGATARGAFAADARDGATRWIVDSAGASPRASRPSPRHDLHEVDPTDASESAYFTRPRTPASAVLERIDADGARRWSVEVPSPCTTVDAAAPGGGPLLFCVAGSELVVVDGERGEPLWRRTPASGPVPRLLLPLVGAPPRVVTSHPRGAAILDPSDGRELAVIDLESPSPVMTRHDWDGDGHDELVFSTEAGTVEAVDEAGRRVGSAAVGMRVRRLVPLGDLDRDGLAELGLVSDGGFAHLEGPRTAWIRRTQKGIRATPRIADFDGDGRREIAVAATLDQREAIVLLDLESGREVGRAPDIGHDLIRPPALVPGPRGLELLYADRLSRGVVRYDPIRGEFTASSPGIRSFASPAIADLDGDGGDEAVIVGWYATTPLSIFDADTLDLLWTFALPDGAWAGPIVASPPTAPERPRIVLALNNGDLLVLDAAARRTLWSRPFGRHDVAPAVADLDGDGALDLLVAHVTDNRADLVRLDLESGDELWSRADAGALKARPIVGDVDGDGVLEIVSVSERDGAVVLGVDGRERWRYRPSPGAPAQPAASASPVLVDLDGDGRRELLTAFDGAGLHVLDSATGALRWRYAIDEAATIEAEPIAVDVDGDGVDEIVIADRGGSIALVRGIRGAGAR